MKAMRILVMFDLPILTKSEKRQYTEFRKFLIADGYRMEQYSVYSRIALGRDALETHIARLQRNLPKYGTITAYTFTEKQYKERYTLRKTRKQEEETEISAQLTLFF